MLCVTLISELADKLQWNGTCDWAPFLSLLAALDFRQACGGEAAINKYCHTLAVEGGELVAQLLGTAVMKNGPNESNLIANMVSRSRSAHNGY